MTFNTLTRTLLAAGLLLTTLPGWAETINLQQAVEMSLAADPRIKEREQVVEAARGMLQVSVITPRTLDSEAWTKPFFILGRTWTEAHRQNFRVFLCEDRMETACVSLP